MRFEPRRRKRRPKPYDRLMKPRDEAERQMLNGVRAKLVPFGRQPAAAPASEERAERFRLILSDEQLPAGLSPSYLLEEMPLAVLPVPRLLPGTETAAVFNGQAPSLLLLGDVDFDGSSASASSQGRIAAGAERSGRQRNWQRLPGTAGEIQAIEALFKRHHRQGKIDTLKELQANESAFRERAARCSHLHLATHGFFAAPAVPDALAINGESRASTGLFGKHQVTGFHPGLLSGLVLAGANQPLVRGQEDGVLTALEVAELDLRKVELAVLSACETGLGKVAGGEGVLGLQRAFQVAGAKTTVTSLWSVPDEPTRVLMERFYANLWEKQMSKLDALREAQLWMLCEGRSHAGVRRGIQRPEQTPAPVTTGRLPPYYWAAFVLSGDWR